MTDARVVTTALGGSPLAGAMQRGRVSDAWHRAPLGVEQWRTVAESVRERFAGRQWLDALRPAIEPGGPAERRLERVQRLGGVLVTSGQQPGLFGGPLYTWNKALTALALADAFERATGIAAAPLFWAATDDSDFEEARGALLAVEGGTREISLSSAPSDGTSMSAAPLGDVEPLLQALAAASGGAAYLPALDAARRAYGGPGATVGSAYLTLLRDLLAPLGIGVLDASHEAVRAAAAPLLRRAQERAFDVDAALLRREQEIRAGGFTPQVEHLPGMSLVFASEGGVRRRLRVGDDVAAMPDAALSPNVLLRPVVERMILPTIAYAAGPGELAYFAQVGAVSDVLEVERPVAVPRWSAMIIEPSVQRALDRIALTADDLRDPHRAAATLAQRHLPESVRSSIEALQQQMEQSIRQLRAQDEQRLVDDSVLEGLSRNLRHRIDRLRRRYLAAVKRREQQVMRDLATAQGALYPDGVAQERVISFLPMLARGGVPLLDAMRAEALAHAVRVLGPGAASVAVAGEPAAELTR